jgi:hypothetical protein
MTDLPIKDTLLLVAQPGHPPGTVRPGLCIYCRTNKLVYWPPASRLPSADCPGCQRRQP